jgi:dihydroxyacetone kinase-like protein
VTVPFDRVVAWVRSFAAVIGENKTYLTELDSAIGDADHGINMDRGMRAVLGKLDAAPQGDVGALLKTVGMTLVSTVGGAGGPLYGTLFMQMGAATTGTSELEPRDWADALAKGIEGVKMRGKAEPGDKTMLDALLPALDALNTAIADGSSFARPRGAARVGGRGRGRHEGHHPARRAQGPRELPRRAERRTPGPGRHVLVPAPAHGGGHVRRMTTNKEVRWRTT